MCDVIELLNGEDIDTVQGFEKHFNLDSSTLRYKGDSTIIHKDSCLCQIDVKMFMSEKDNFQWSPFGWREI